MPLKPSSPAEFENALLGIDAQQERQSQNMYDNLFKLAQLMNMQSEAQFEQGTKAQPPQVSATKPAFGGMRGFEEVTALPEDIQGGSLSVDRATADALTLGKPVHFKQGKEGSVGLKRLAKRIDLLPYIASPDKDKDLLAEEIHTLLTEPDDEKAISAVTFGPRKAQKNIVVSADISSALKKAGYDIAVGTIVTQDEYNNLLKAADLGFKSEREERLTKTTAKDLLIKSIRTEIMKMSLESKKSEASIEAAIQKALKRMDEEKVPPIPEPKKGGLFNFLPGKK